ncbi:hypothetical protein EMIHUDRAFT_469691 [Emiliania huxleyi CCMP1516]|uniref:Uncharacterized protein n=2 Tax=Emiliania huxleyi TaxID=2903 RepID=A0A0D3JET7_EMIH1|nr:hypothetical protein EMIHUDRAFT_469691 [Emiliania huxleyi CCMP1516]EOD22022.1 hypothetical protein EMIHUDRAFT_469691 [Emiliania huxleyi CCMP1516]|eukprot:XP_005774451.1 hypothetical protein EMIHUDRAFT_469691 [Emiliania huxleyi CCMP1516]
MCTLPSRQGAGPLVGAVCLLPRLSKCRLHSSVAAVLARLRWAGSAPVADYVARAPDHLAPRPARSRWSRRSAASRTAAAPSPAPSTSRAPRRSGSSTSCCWSRRARRCTAGRWRRCPALSTAPPTGLNPRLEATALAGRVPVDSQVPDFLRGCGVPCPPSVNPADVVVDLTHTKEADADEDGGEAVDLVARFAESDLRREIEAEIDSVEIGRHPALADLAAQSLKAPQEEEGRGGCCGGGGGGGYPNPLLHQVGVLVRRQWTLDLRDFGYKFTWVLNGFVLALNASTYLLVAQARSPSPPLDAQPASVYRDDMGCSASLGSGDGVQGCVCHLDMADSADGGYTVADDVAECGQALVARTNVDFAHRGLLFLPYLQRCRIRCAGSAAWVGAVGFLFLVVNALFINEATRRAAAAAAAAGGGAAAAPSPSPPLGATAAIADLRPPPVTPPDELPSAPPTPKSSSKRRGGLATPASATSTPSRWSKVRDVVAGADTSRGDGAAALRGQYPLSPLRRTLDQARARLVFVQRRR